jgi:Uma2 family endonuclease
MGRTPREVRRATDPAMMYNRMAANPISPIVLGALMATASATKQHKPTPVQERPETLADLLKRLGNIPANRVRLRPAPGTATEEDVIRNNESLFRTALCELVDGTLVEKPVGWEESAIAILIARFLGNFVQPRKLGTVLGSDGMLRLVPGLMRAPDVSFIARGRLKRYKKGGERYPSIGADLAVEVYSKSNTKAEIGRKLKEYFAAGTRLAWIVDPKTETVRVHRSPEEFVVLKVGDVLDGGDVLPGFQVPVQELFELDDD